MLPTNDGVVVSSILYFHPGSLGKISNLTKTFQMGWFKHQLDEDDFAFGTTQTIGIFAFYGISWGVCKVGPKNQFLMEWHGAPISMVK